VHENHINDSPQTRGLVSGIKRLRTSGGKAKKGGKRIMADHDAFAGGYKFPRGKATPKQKLATTAVIDKHIRRVVVDFFGDLTAATIGGVFGLKDRQAKAVVKQCRDLGVSPTAALAMDVLRGMASGEIPCVLDMPESQDNRALLRWVYAAKLDPWFDLAKVPWMKGQQATFFMLHAAFRRDFIERERRRRNRAVRKGGDDETDEIESEGGDAA
jgi:hypothetical protein